MRYSSIFIALQLLWLASCDTQVSGSTNYDIYREAVRAKMRDPASASFRNERLRTLWSNEGSRLKLYCADLNGNNAFGGKTGFGPALYVISARASGKGDTGWWKAGSVDIQSTSNSDYYMRCERPDTQRTDKDFFAGYAQIGEFDEYQKAELDKAEPAISNLVAPEDR